MDAATYKAIENALIEVKRDAEKAVALAEARLRTFYALPENNVFPSLDEAEDVLTNRFENYASADCEGSHNRGSDKYTQRFTCAGKTYGGTLLVDYNRHDKMYYYPDGSTYELVEVPEQA